MAVSSPAPVQDLDAILARANRPTAQHRLCLNNTLYRRWQAAEKEWEAAAVAAAAGSDRLSGSATARAAAEDLRAAADELRAEVEADSVEFRFEALPFAAYNRLAVSHPPRKGNRDDEAWGYNTLDFFPALLRACLVSPQASDEQWNGILSRLTDRQFDDLANAVVGINRRESATVPFSPPASGTTTG
jgi:hypothetical protein